MTGTAQATRGRRESAEWEEHVVRTRRSRALRSRRLAGFGFRPGERIAEIGCGDGLNLAILRDAGCRRLVGSDLSPDLLRLVRGAPVFAADVHDLPLGDARLDAALVDSVLHHLEPLGPALAELRRVIRPGGRLCLLEPRPALLRRLMDAAMDRVPFPPPLRARQVTYLEERETYHAWLRRWPDLPREIERAGFQPPRVRRLLLGAALECRRP
jgi:SAM-dependent methyltransferase